jgi:hypothetical protein
MKFSLEKIIKITLLIALALLLFRKGNLSDSFIPKPYEIVFSSTLILAGIDIVLNKKIKLFISSIPKYIWVPLGLLVGSILLGWVIAVHFLGIQTNLNTVLEFGTFIIGISTLLLILFYSRNDDTYARYCLYTLLVPVVYAIAILVPHHIPASLLAIDGNFIGLTENVNLLSKKLLIPVLFFIAYTLHSSNSIKHRIISGVVSILSVSLLFWISSRGAILSLFCGILFLYAVSIYKDRVKQIGIKTGIIILILIMGFIATPYERKQVVLNRVLNSDAVQISLEQVRHKPLGIIIKDSFTKKDLAKNDVVQKIAKTSQKIETRLQIWPFYLQYFVMPNPLGIGPNTHIQSPVTGPGGELVSTGPHNTYLELLLWGGILALGSFLYLLIRACKNMYMRLHIGYISFALIGILATLSIAIIFDDSLGLYSFWAVLALTLRPWNQ